MATVTTRVDDLDRKSKVTSDPVLLSFNGVTVTLDLSNTHRDELDALLRPYLDAGTEVTAPTRKAGKAASTEDADRNAEIRSWAQTQRPDLKVSDRGRLPGAVVTAYEEWEREQLSTPSVQAVA